MVTTWSLHGHFFATWSVTWSLLGRSLGRCLAEKIYYVLLYHVVALGRSLGHYLVGRLVGVCLSKSLISFHIILLLLVGHLVTTWSVWYIM